MKTKLLKILFIINFAFLASCATGGKEQKAAAKSASYLLRGVVHVSDDDVRIKTGSITIFIDPVNGLEADLVRKSGMTAPDLILITHSHSDHFQSLVIKDYLKLNPQAVVVGPADNMYIS